MSDQEHVLPLDGWHRALGARMVPFAGTMMPVQYEGIIAEHLWTRTSAGLFDVSHMGQLHIAGRSPEHGLESLLPSNIKALGDGQLRYSMLLNEEGGIIDDLIVTRRGEHFLLVVNGARKHVDIAYLTQRLPGLVVDHMREQALLALQGPKAVDALERIVPGVGELGFMRAAAFRLGDVPAWISRCGYTGEDGFEISVEGRHVEAVAARLADQPEVRMAGLGARDSLRLEAGLPLYGHDLDDGTSPVEAGLDFAIPVRRRVEGGFPGFERIGRQLDDGPAVRRVGLTIAGRQPVREGAVMIDAQGDEVGKVTSGGYAPTLQTPIAMAYVPAALATPGTRVRLSQRARIFDAEVVPLPFVPHRYHRKEASR